MRWLCRSLSRRRFGVLLAGCTVGPNYKTPSVPMTDSFKEATPADYQTAGSGGRRKPERRGQPRQMVGDLRRSRTRCAGGQLTASNQNLKDSRGPLPRGARDDRLPARRGFPDHIGRRRTPASLQDSSHQPYFLIPNPQPEGELQLPFDLNYEIDLWGRIRRTVAAAREEAQATAADLATASLSLHAELALDYIELRSADCPAASAGRHGEGLRRRAAADPEPAGGRLRARLGRRAGADAACDTTRVQDTDIGVTRAQYEHAIAVLIGEPPAAFSLPPAPLDLRPPRIPPGIPSELLQRRPDIAAAERRVAEANEQIGIAQAAFYPSLNLSALSGFEGTNGATWFGWPSLFWAVGTTLTQPLFDGGRIRAQSDETRAAYDAMSRPTGRRR